MTELEFEKIGENILIYRPPKCDKPIVLKAIPFDAKDYHPVFHVCISKELYDELKKKKEEPPK